MAGFRDFVTARFIPAQPQWGLALLRVCTGATLFLRHGWEKQPTHWVQFMAHFPDPIGFGSHPSFLIAFISDFVCSILLILGVAARWAALWSLVNIFVAWSFVHRFAFFGKGPQSDHGESMILYMGALLTIVIAGPGAASIDRIPSRGR